MIAMLRYTTYYTCPVVLSQGLCWLVHGLQPLPYTVTASATYGYSIHQIGLPPPPHTVTAFRRMRPQPNIRYMRLQPNTLRLQACDALVHGLKARPDRSLERGPCSIRRNAAGGGGGGAARVWGGEAARATLERDAKAARGKLEKLRLKLSGTTLLQVRQRRHGTSPGAGAVPGPGAGPSPSPGAGSGEQEVGLGHSRGQGTDLEPQS